MKNHHRCHTGSIQTTTTTFKLLFPCIALVLIVGGKTPALSQGTLLANDPIVSIVETNLPIQDAILRVCRAANLKVIIDPACAASLTRALPESFSGMKASEILGRIGRQHHLGFEKLGSDTIYVVQKTSGDELEETSTIASTSGNGTAFGAEITSEATPPPTIDDALKMPVSANTQRAPSKKIVLSGGIEHRTQLEPVKKNLRVGAQVDVRQLHTLTPGNVWSRLPNWAGGTWKTVSMTAYYRYNYIHATKNLYVDTFMDKGAETFGWQKDKVGQLWHFVGTDFYTVAEGETDYSVDFHKIHEIVEQDERHFVAHHVSTRALVAKTTHKVERVFQVESINTYTLLDGNTMRCKSSLKEFDDQGRAATLQKGISYEMRFRPYAAWNTYKNKDMRKLFAEYLMLHGLGPAVP